MSSRRIGGKQRPVNTAHDDGLSGEDTRLWEMMKRRLQPLHNVKRHVTAHLARDCDERPVKPVPNASRAMSPAGKIAERSAEPTDRHPPRPHTPGASKVTLTASTPSPHPIEKRKSRRLAKGQHPIESVLDLHGMRQREAHAALRHFLVNAHAKGLKFVKVITGKGGRPGAGDPLNLPFNAAWSTGGDWGSSGERGVLKRLVPEWLHDDDLRRIVVAFSSAGRGHGGEGALYVELRRKVRSGG